MNTPCEVLPPVVALRSESETLAAMLAATGGRKVFGVLTHEHNAALGVIREDRAALAARSQARDERAAVIAAGCVASLDSGCQGLGSLPCEPSSPIEGPLDPFSSDFWSELLATMQECTADLRVLD